jgi:hypothetical protein
MAALLELEDCALSQSHIFGESFVAFVDYFSLPPSIDFLLAATSPHVDEYYDP